MTKSPECPECEKLSAVRDQSHVLGEFLEWMKHNTDYIICEWDNEEEAFYMTPDSIEKILALRFDIDLDKVEEERRALLEWIQEENE